MRIYSRDFRATALDKPTWQNVRQMLISGFVHDVKLNSACIVPAT